MIRNLLFRFSVPLVVVLGIIILGWWFMYNPTNHFHLSLPGMDNRKAGKAASSESVKIGEEYVYYKDCPDVPGTRWPRFRGENYDNINKEKISLISHWGKEGPKILWKKQVGDGHAAPAIYDGRIYFLDYDERTRSDALRCLSLQTGEELWHRSYKVHLKRNHGLSRTIPTVSGNYVVSIGPRGHVMCVDRLKGNLLWGIDLEKEYQAEIPFWYTGQCPVIDHDTAIIAVGGRSLIIAVDCKTGKIAWETPNPHKWKMSHASLMPMNLGGKRSYVYVAVGGICGISSSGKDAGKVLWENNGFSPAVVAPSPVVMDNGTIVMTAGYGAGTAVFRVLEQGGTFSIKMTDQFKPSEGIASEQQTPIVYNGYLYSILPKDAGELRNRLAGYKPGNCRKALITSSKSERFGLGPYIVADNKFFILNDDGELTIATVDGNDFRILDQARIIEGQDSWGPLAITGGYLVMRDSKTMVCIDIKSN